MREGQRKQRNVTILWILMASYWSSSGLLSGEGAMKHRLQWTNTG